jgi:drug/metabolite transporter (DMT)-like permease
MKFPKGLILVVAVLSLSMSALFVKWSTAPVSIVLLYRMVVAVMFLSFLRPWQRLRVLNRKEWGILIIAGLLFTAHMLAWMASIHLTTVASSMIIMSLTPIFALAGQRIFFAQRPTRAKVVFSVIAVLGSILVAGGGLRLTNRALLGDLLAFAAMICYACYLLIGQRLMKKTEGTSYSFIIFSMTALIALAVNLLTGTDLIHYSGLNWLMFVLLGLVCSFSGQMLTNVSLKYFDANSVAMAILGEPVIAITLSWIIFAEKMAGLQLAGSALTVIALLFFFRKENPKQQNV